MNEKTTRLLPAKMNDQEKLTVGDDLAKTLMTLSVAITDKKAVMKQHSGAIKSLQDQIEVMSRSLSTETMDKDVECQWTTRGDDRILIRLDTGDVVEVENEDDD